MIAEQLMDSMELNRFFDEASLDFDLREGVIWNPAKTRLCLLSADLLGGVYKALVDEAGPAWKLIFKNCGVVWGERVARRLDREFQVLGGKRLGDMLLDDYLKFMTNYFRFHGWGQLHLDVSQARESGLVLATLKHSVFAEIIQNPDEMVDSMISGILCSMLKYMSGHDLDCVQITCSSKGAELSRFVITGRERLKPAESLLQSGIDYQKFIESI